jgi:hypothetical protein
MGGALFNMQGSVTITNSTLAANSAIGGSGGAANGGQPAAGGQGLGGAIFNFNGQITVVSSTLAQNVASDDGGGIDNLGYDSSTLRAASVTLSNSIVFGSTDGAGNPVSDLFADQPTRVAVSGGGGSNQGVASTNASQADIVGRLGTGGIGSITGSPSSANPGLGVLAFNGGPGMATMALGPGSPALAAGAGCPATDERGVARPSGLCDLGAFQLSAPPPGSGPAPVSVAVSGLRVTPAKFSVAGRRVGGRCVKATRANRGRPRCSLPIALRVTFTLNEPGTVVIRVTRKAPGRRVVGRCVTPTRKNRRHMRCTRFILLPGAVTLTAAAGANAFTFDGRIAGRALGPGTYELTAAPSGATQNGTSQTATFQLVR